ncbi:hypothetical protein NHX12_020347 [Muraenolepis orangiensis]|uniref:Periphilin-1 C-terminal domain-containing protein n=1 Tax=Muraenolepis orangiensis TaxID=630683 RepID=A0A9Q0IVQ8_9TELE|nr:hypothetical protein NHX12_020347 [Muraenolepis orangiensis]
MSYPRAAGAPERRGPFGRPEEDYGRGGYDYDGGPRYFPNGGGPRNYHGEDQRSYHGDNLHFPAERRAGPPARREEYPYRVPREDPPHPARTVEFGMRAPPPHAVRSQGMYPAPRTIPESGDDSLMQAILSLDRRRKSAPFPPIRDRSPVRRSDVPRSDLPRSDLPRSDLPRSDLPRSDVPRSDVPRSDVPRSDVPRSDVPRSPHSRSGSSVSSRSYSPDRAKALPFNPQQGKVVDGPEGHAVDHLWGAHFPHHSAVHDGLDKLPGLSRDVSPQSTPSAKEEAHPAEVVREEPATAALPVALPAPPPPSEESQRTAAEDFQERRACAINSKARAIEKVYRQDCETFGMVVKMLVAKDPDLEKQLQVPLRENLGEIRERCLEDLKHFISELDESVGHPEPLA